MVMALALVGSAATAFLLTPAAWWVCGSAAGLTVLYLGYLRRQTRIEERVQRRRMQRMARSRLGVENTYDREFDVVPSRLRRPGAVVWRSTTRTRSSSISTTLRTRGITAGTGICREPRAVRVRRLRPRLVAC